MKLLRGERKQIAVMDGDMRYCGVAAAMIGAAVIGGVATSSAADSAADSASASAANSTNAQERIAARELDFAKEQDAANRIRFAKADELTEKVTNKQLASMDQNMALAADYDNYNKTTFRPLEQGIIDEAKKYDSPAEQERAASEASASVKQNIAQATEANNRNLARMGVNPSSGRSQVTASQTAITGALGEASAENTARQNVKTLGAAKRMDAASLGRNLPSAQATSASVGINAGNAAINGTATTNNSVTNGNNSVGGLYGAAGNQFSSAASNYSNIAGAANAAAARSGAAWGQIGGMAMNYAMNRPPASFTPNSGGVGADPYAGFDAASAGGWGIE
jgi:hypothetical protein